MSADGLTPRNEQENTTPAALLVYQDEPGGWPSGELIRLFVVPAMVAVLFVGGVYWIRLRLPAGSAGQPSTSVVEVHLLPRPEAAPIAVASVSHPATENVASRVEASLERPEPAISDDPAPKPKAFSPAEAPPCHVGTLGNERACERCRRKIPAGLASACRTTPALPECRQRAASRRQGRYAILDGEGRHAARRLGANEFWSGRARQGGNRDHPPVATAAAHSAGIARAPYRSGTA
jgi:hypothetical protein